MDNWELMIRIKFVRSFLVGICSTRKFPPLTKGGRGDFPSKNGVPSYLIYLGFITKVKKEKREFLRIHPIQKIIRVSHEYFGFLADMLRPVLIIALADNQSDGPLVGTLQISIYRFPALLTMWLAKCDGNCLAN